ncbi:hypothetical protein ALC60_06809, partial [Trachymyrmex zeteki]
KKGRERERERERREREREREKGWPRKYIRLLTRATSTDALLRSASGSEVKGSAIRCGIGNYSPERGRALLTFITELSASLGKQCASFNPPCTTAYLLLASPLNGISVLSDGPRAELRPCTSLGRFLPLSVVARPALTLSRFSSYSGSLRNISRERSAAPILLFLFRLRDSDYNALYEVDIVTNVMEPSTIFRD